MEFNFQNLLFIYLAINVFTFLAYGLDKFFAKKQMYRISEKFLLGCAACFGAVGALAGMYTFRHKTQKPAFYIGVPTLLIGNIAAIYLFFIKK